MLRKIAPFSIITINNLNFFGSNTCEKFKVLISKKV